MDVRIKISEVGIEFESQKIKIFFQEGKLEINKYNNNNEYND